MTRTFATVAEHNEWTVTHPVTDALDSQGTIQRGTQGWWKVWGARVSDIRAGDLIMVKANGEITEHAVTGIVTETGMLASIFLRFTDATGADIRIGTMCPVIVLRQGTENTLAASI